MKQSYKYKNFTYILDGNHEVVTDPASSLPQSVYKYYSNSKNSLDALLNSYLYATHPYSFNDSIDSSDLLLNFDKITFDRYLSFFKRTLKPEEFEKFNYEEMFEVDKKESFAGIRKFFYEYFTRNLGIISLTTEPINILMWSHYSSESGFLIELEANCLINNLRKNNTDIKNYCFRPVQYVDQLESIEVFQDGFTTPDVAFLYMTNVKRSEWSYEEEWRLAVYKTDMGIPFNYLLPGAKDYSGSEERKVYYSRDCVKSLIIGKYFFNGKNCDKLNEDRSIVITNPDFLNLVNYLIENHNDKLFMSGELQKGNKFGRSVSKIQIDKVDDNTFKLVDLEEVFTKE